MKERLIEALVYLFIVAAIVAFGCLTWMTWVTAVDRAERRKVSLVPGRGATNITVLTETRQIQLRWDDTKEAWIEVTNVTGGVK